MKTENGVTTKYVYGLGLIYEETTNDIKVYHYDYRGSTVALTDSTGYVTDTFEYDTYGSMTARTGTTVTPFLYNGRDGVMTDENGLVYMRARYYSPVLKRFINADVVAGSITNSITLNRYAYANGNPVSNIDPFGLSAERGGGTYWTATDSSIQYKTGDPSNESFWYKYDILPKFDEYNQHDWLSFDVEAIENIDNLIETLTLWSGKVKFERRTVNGVDKIIVFGKNWATHSDIIDIPQRIINADSLSSYSNIGKYIDGKVAIRDAFSPYANILKGNFKNVSDILGVAGDVIGIFTETASAVSEYEEIDDKFAIGTYTVVTEAAETVLLTAASAKIGAAIGSAVCPGLGTLVGFGVGIVGGWLFDRAQEWFKNNVVDNWLED